MFIAAKLLAFMSQPLAWVALLILAALLAGRTKPGWASGLSTAALSGLLLLGWEPLPDALLRQLEAQYPPIANSQSTQRYAGVIVLGGALEPAYVWSVPGQSALNDAAERMTEASQLARLHPQLKLLFTGGEGELFGGNLSEARRARMFFEQQGIAPTQMLFESASCTTYENAILSKQVAGVNPAQPWLLLTSAWHMPRSMAVFHKAGWNVTAFPVDFRAGTHTPWTQYSMDSGAQKWHLALHELLGLLAYRLAGRI
ncbi:hypothetical protein GALL_544470 [mine drainage metagenome]|uniref:DUF218 domain-containing protein n=1 Tax=mine drainage metagenome TaxID=410659 RepID=A0A1J5NYX6_9ZZZZ